MKWGTFFRVIFILSTWKNHYLLCSSFIINFFPSYLKDITAGIRNSTFHINTRISSNHSLPRCRYEVFSKCFFFSNTIRKWNSLSTNTKEATSLSWLKVQSDFTKPPKYFFFDERLLNIIHITLRHNCIFLILIFIDVFMWNFRRCASLVFHV